MKTNVGNIDRILRAGLGVVLLYLAFLSNITAFEAPLIQYGVAIIGIVMLVTSILKLCPLYTLLGIKTCRNC